MYPVIGSLLPEDFGKNNVFTYSVYSLITMNKFNDPLEVFFLNGLFQLIRHFFLGNGFLLSVLLDKFLSPFRYPIL